MDAVRMRWGKVMPVGAPRVVGNHHSGVSVIEGRLIHPICTIVDLVGLAAVRLRSISDKHALTGHNLRV